MDQPSSTTKFTKNLSKEIVKTVIHTILFHRVFGSLQPKEVEVLGLTFPQVADTEINKLVNEQTERLVIALEHKSSVLLSIRFLENRFTDHNKNNTTTTNNNNNNNQEKIQVVRSMSKEEMVVNHQPTVWEKWEIGFKIHSTTAFPSSSNQDNNNNGNGNSNGNGNNSNQQPRSISFNPIGFFNANPIHHKSYPPGDGDQTKSIKSIQLQLSEFLTRLIHFAFEQRDHIPPITNTDLSPFPVDISILPVSNIM